MTFTVNDDVVASIAEITTPHLRSLNEDITEAYSEQPDAAFTLGLGFAVATLLNSMSNPEQRAEAVNGINLLVRHCGYALTPVS